MSVILRWFGFFIPVVVWNSGSGLNGFGVVGNANQCHGGHEDRGIFGTHEAELTSEVETPFRTLIQTGVMNEQVDTAFAYWQKATTLLTNEDRPAAGLGRCKHIFGRFGRVHVITTMREGCFRSERKECGHARRRKAGQESQ